MENILQNLFAPEAKICGVWLRRYTLWNHLLLGAFRSPFLSNDPSAQVTAADLLLAVELCRTPWPQRPRTRPRLSSLPWRFRLRFRRTFLLQTHCFATWLACHLEGPVFWRDTAKTGSAITAPELYSLAYGLTAKCHLTESEAWNKSPGQAETILATVAELEGAELHFADPEILAAEAEALSDRERVYAQAVQDLGQKAADQFIQNWQPPNRVHN